MNQKEFLKKVKENYPELYAYARQTDICGSWKTNFGILMKMMRIVNYRNRSHPTYMYEDLYDHIKRLVKNDESIRMLWVLNEL